jgi:hypothetical protein
MENQMIGMRPTLSPNQPPANVPSANDARNANNAICANWIETSNLSIR